MPRPCGVGSLLPSLLLIRVPSSFPSPSSLPRWIPFITHARVPKALGQGPEQQHPVLPPPTLTWGPSTLERTLHAHTPQPCPRGLAPSAISGRGAASHVQMEWSH